MLKIIAIVLAVCLSLLFVALCAAAPSLIFGLAVWVLLNACGFTVSYWKATFVSWAVTVIFAFTFRLLK